MDRKEARKQKFAKQLVKFPLGDQTFWLRPLSARERAIVIDTNKKIFAETPGKADGMVIGHVVDDLQSFIVCRALVDESGERWYQDDEQTMVADEIFGDDLVALSDAILKISGIYKQQTETEKNSEPTQEELKNSSSRLSSEGGM